MPPRIIPRRDPKPVTGDGTVVSFARLEAEVSLASLQAELDALLSRDWLDHVNRRDYEGGWDVLPLRCQRQHVHGHPILQGFAIHDGDDWQDLPVLDGCPEIRRVLAQLHCPLASVRLMRLRAGAHIKPHRDDGLAIESGLARLHLPIETSDEVEFRVNGRPVPMRAGELWYFNADQTHEVFNRGRHDRVNLVIDCSANAWLVDRVVAAHLAPPDHRPGPA